MLVELKKVSRLDSEDPRGSELLHVGTLLQSGLTTQMGSVLPEQELISGHGKTYMIT